MCFDLSSFVRCYNMKVMQTWAFENIVGMRHNVMHTLVVTVPNCAQLGMALSQTSLYCRYMDWQGLGPEPGPGQTQPFHGSVQYYVMHTDFSKKQPHHAVDGEVRREENRTPLVAWHGLIPRWQLPGTPGMAAVTGTPWKPCGGRCCVAGVHLHPMKLGPPTGQQNWKCREAWHACCIARHLLPGPVLEPTPGRLCLEPANHGGRHLCDNIYLWHLDQMTQEVNAHSTTSWEGEVTLILIAD